MDHRMRLDWHDNILCFTEYMQQIGNKNNCYCTTHVLYTTRDSLGKNSNNWIYTSNTLAVGTNYTNVSLQNWQATRKLHNI